MENFYTLYVGVTDDRNFKLTLLPAKCNESQLTFKMLIGHAHSCKI